MAEAVPADDALAPLWQQMDARALKRAARCPVLLVDLHFQRLDRWLHMTQRLEGPVLSAASMAAAERESSLLKEIMLEAWTLGRTMPRALSLLFGMASEVTGTILKLGASDIDRIALEEARHLKARWPESRTFWKGLLEAAIGTDDRALSYVHLHCLQLLGSEALP